MDVCTISIIKTLSYFDIFDYPLTSWEIHTFLLSDTRYEYRDVRSALLAAPVEQKDGFYFLPGRAGIVTMRHKRYISNIFKMRKARRAILLWAYVPFVRMIAICNNLSFFNAKKESDLDMFIVVKKQALPIVRLLTVLISVAFFKRPRAGSFEDALCLSFFVDSSHISLKDVSEKNDIYMKYWVATSLPLYDSDGNQYKTFLKANSFFISEFQNFVYRNASELNIKINKFVKKVFEFIFLPVTYEFFSEKIFKFQKKRLPKRLAETMNTSTSIMITPSIFKTHVHDARRSVQKQWEKRYNAIV